MISKEYILKLAEEFLSNTTIFVSGIKISSDNHINLYIDGDIGVTIKDCVSLSRYIEGNLNREKEDYALDVSSHGATTPLVYPRQYHKHIGRNFEIKLQDGSKTEGILLSCNDKEIKLETTTRENKLIGKGKIDVIKQELILFEKVKESKIKLKY